MKLILQHKALKSCVLIVAGLLSAANDTVSATEAKRLKRLREFMKNGYLVFSLMAFALVVSGCGTVGSLVKGDYDLAKADGKGLVVVSTRLIDQCGRVGGLNAHIFKKDEKNAIGTVLIVKNILMAPHIGADGYFAIYEFPAGDYGIGKLSATGFTLMARHTKDPEMLSFDVNPGEVVYIGEIAFTVSKGCDYVTAQVGNEWRRDAKLFKARVRNIPADSVKMGLAKRIRK